MNEDTLVVVGVCFLRLDEQGKIRRNEVYFDPTVLVRG